MAIAKPLGPEFRIGFQNMASKHCPQILTVPMGPNDWRHTQPIGFRIKILKQLVELGLKIFA